MLFLSSAIKTSSRHLMLYHFVNESFHKKGAVRRSKNYAREESGWEDNNMGHVGPILHLF